MLIWNREVLNPLNEKTEDQTLVNRILNIYNNFLISDINKVVVKSCVKKSDKESFEFSQYSQSNSDEMSVISSFDNDIFKTHNNSSGNSTAHSSIDSYIPSNHILSNKNIYEEMNSFEFQSQHIVEK